MINPVEEYLRNNEHKKVSIRYLSKELSLKKKKTDYYIHNTLKIRTVNPSEVGSGKYKLNVYTYSH